MPVRDLIVVAGPCSGLRVPFTARRYVVGRSTEADVAVPDRFLSRRHFALDVSPEGASVSVTPVRRTGRWWTAGRSRPEQLGQQVVAAGFALTILGHRPLTRRRTSDDGQPVTITRRRRVNEDSGSRARDGPGGSGTSPAADAHRLRAAAPDAADYGCAPSTRAPTLGTYSADTDALRLRVGQPRGLRRKAAAARRHTPHALTVDLLPAEPILLTGDAALADSLLPMAAGSGRLPARAQTNCSSSWRFPATTR